LRVRVIALNKVDLPTFGSPTMPALNICSNTKSHQPDKAVLLPFNRGKTKIPRQEAH
jgi:hypothetical protein